MKCTIPEISWHNRDPVLSIDIQPRTNDSQEFYRLASGGTDSHVLIWFVKRDNETGSVNLDVVADLTRHQRAVNCVRWCPNGELLASGDDESVIMIWKLKSDNETVNICDSTNDTDKEIWITLKILRGHMEDIYDLCWSPNSVNLISGSVDNTAIVWDVQKGKSIEILNCHKGFVQGVAWDPQNRYLATLSTDRKFRVFDLENSKKCVSCNSKCLLPVPESSPYHGKTVRLYHDDTLQTFFRRLSFSPDGEIIVVPSGVAEIEGVLKPLNTTYIYTRYSIKQPSAVLPSPDQYTVAVRFSPIKYVLRKHSPENTPLIPLQYRMVFAVATKSCVYLYDTQQKIPFGVISNIHYTRLTDLAWSYDGRCLIVSSTDGFCSIILFNENEIGEIYKEETEQGVLKLLDENKENKTPIEESKDEKDVIIEANDANENKISVEIKENCVKLSSDINAGTLIMPSIISSENKFESPEKKDNPATPIAVRRYPRKSLDNPESSPVSGISAIQSSSAKKATPIEVRRKPRQIIDKLPSAPPQVEEAVDAWPIDQKVPFSPPVVSSQPPFPTTHNSSHPEQDSDTNMRLIYEDEDEEIPDTKCDSSAIKPSEPVTPVANRTTSDMNTGSGTPKTPRRVDFKTISTPKSKKKLL